MNHSQADAYIPLAFSSFNHLLIFFLVKPPFQAVVQSLRYREYEYGLFIFSRFIQL